MTDVEIWVEGEPVPKGRPRYGKGNHMYTPPKTRDAENRIRKAWQEEGGREISGPVSISCWFFLETPKSWSKARKALAEIGEILPEKVPDIDNLVKTVLDALNGLAFTDDKEVVRMFVSKQYREKPGTLVRVRAL